MWERPALPASSKERCEGWDSFTVPPLAGFRHFHGPVLCLRICDGKQVTPPDSIYALAHKLTRYGERETRSCTLMPIELLRADGVPSRIQPPRRARVDIRDQAGRLPRSGPL